MQVPKHSIYIQIHHLTGHLMADPEHVYYFASISIRLMADFKDYCLQNSESQSAMMTEMMYSFLPSCNQYAIKCD